MKRPLSAEMSSSASPVERVSGMVAGLAAAVKPGAARVLVMEPRRVVRRGLVAVLRAAGLDVRRDTASPQAALAALRRGLAVDVVVCSSRGAARLLPALQAEYPGPGVLVLSGRPPAETFERWRRAGAAGVISANPAPGALVAAVTAVARDGVYLSPEIARRLVLGEPDAPVLSAQEMAAVRLVATGYTRTETAARMHVATDTARSYLGRARRKLGLRTDADLTRYAIRQDWVDVGLETAPDIPPEA